MLSYGLLSLALASVSVASQKCKCLPGESCFPSQAQLDAFSSNLSQPLIFNQTPIASVCYPTSSNFNPSACTAASINDDIDQFIAMTSNTLQSDNFEALITNTSVQACPFNPAPNSTCFQGRVPSFSVNVTTVEDIQNTIRFASKYNLHLVVKNTGHELLGRAFGVGSIELFTHNLQGTNFSDNFVPLGAPPSTQGQDAVTIGSGVQWGDLYREVDAQNRSIAGGFSDRGTVGAGGGWPLGGGHSVLSPLFGLGVDNILQYSVVLPNASFVTANEFQNTDLFWALRGGGGPSFGVVTSATHRTHPNLPYTAAFYAATANSSESYRQLLVMWAQIHNEVADAGWTGPWPFFQNSLFLTLITPGTPPTSASANSTLESFFSASKAIPGVTVSVAMSVEYPSFFVFFDDNLVDSSKGFGLNFTSLASAGRPSVASSWLMPRNLTAPENAAQLGEIFANISVGIPFLVGGGVVSTVPGNATAITPAWRTVISDMTSTATFNLSSSAEEIQAVLQDLHDQFEPLRQLAPIPVGGQYLNEADALEVDWQGAQWGSNYPRLLSIKREVDPNDLLIVHHGVNSEDWDDEVICKTV